jgi:hypothetical protein
MHTLPVAPTSDRFFRRSALDRVPATAEASWAADTISTGPDDQTDEM